MSQSRLWFKISAIIAFILFVIAASSPFLKHVKTSFLPVYEYGAEKATFKAPKHNVWADLSEGESDAIVGFLLKSEELNLTDSAKATSEDNAILLIELLQPNKSDVMSYLEQESRPPRRWARVAIDQGASEEPRTVNYMVGPLPIDETSSVLPLEFCYNSGRNYIVKPLADYVKLQEWMKSYVGKVFDILTELLGTDEHPYDVEDLSALQRVSFIEHGHLIIWIELYRPGLVSDATSLLPQGLYVQLNASTKDTSNWKVLQWYYHNKLYPNETALRSDMASPNFQKTGLNIDGPWTALEDFSSSPPARSIPAPTMIQPSGPRYLIDKKENYISWLGFSFYFSTSSDVALSLHHIRFNNDSIIHELGMQEALAHYSGDDPKQGGQEFLDSFLYMGLYMYELVPGYDCPAYATFLSTSYNFGGKTKVNRRSICVFEYTDDAPLQRHTADRRVTVSRNTYLVVRYVSTMWNYDYTFDYIFYLDGTVEVKVRASGFIFGAFWTGKKDGVEDEYGYRVQEALSTSMHDHVINFKADLDIAGTQNTMVKVGIEPLTASYPWDELEGSTPRNTMHLVHSTISTETGLNWPANAGEMFIVQNENKRNKWGEKRGYRIMPGTGVGAPIHLTILNSTTLGASARWAGKDLWVTRRKDSEPRSSSALNYFSPLEPLVDFEGFVDGEDVVDEDLVIWFNLGTHHVPHSGDIPNTLMHISSSSVMFTPFNFHDRDMSIHTRQGVKMEVGREPRYFGGVHEEGVWVEKEDLEPDARKYQVPVDAGTNHSSIDGLGFDKFGGPGPWS